MTLFCPSSRHKTRRGFNLIEAAIVLGVVGLVIGGIWSATAAVMQKHRVSQTLEGYFSIAQQMNRQFGRTAITENCDAWRCGIELTNAQKQAMITPPAGWHFNADGTLDSPILKDMAVSVYSPVQAVQDYNAIAIWNHGAVNSESDCKSLGIEALKSLSRGNLIWAKVWSFGWTKYAGGDLYHGAYRWSTDTDSGTGFPDPLLAAQVDGCNFVEIDIMRE